jgi:outer membrane immunogenic protein
MPRFIAPLAVTSFLLAGPAFAADMPVKALPPAPIYSWTGWYVGVNAGYGWSSDPVNVVGTPIFANPTIGTSPASLAAAVAGATGNFPVNSKGFIGGGQFGYNAQFNRLVLGVETDIQGTSLRGSANGANVLSIVGFPGTGPTTTTFVSNKLEYLGTLRGQIGFTLTPTFLLYGTGGLAYGGVNSTTNIGQVVTGPAATGANGPYGSAANFSDTRVGWTAGAGLAWMMYSRWTAKIEYLHYDLGSVNYGGAMSNIVVPGSAVPPGTTFYTLGAGSTTRFTGDIVRLGLNYKLSN